MIKRNMILGFLCLLLLTTLIVPAMAASACTVSVQADGNTHKHGESVTLKVEISQNPGFSNFDLGIVYDRNVLTLTGIQTQQDVKLSDTETVSTPFLCGPLAVVNLQYIDEENGNALIGYIAAANVQNVTKNGTLFTLSFTVKENAPGGKTQVSIKPFTFVNEQRQELNVSYLSAELTIDAPAGEQGSNGQNAGAEAQPSASMDNFKRTVTYSGYSDVDESKWYGTQKEGAVRCAVQLGIMAGRGNGKFAPEDNITLAEVIKMAAVTHSIYMGDGYIFDQSQGDHWWDTYLTYAVFSGILDAKDFRDLQQTATRAQMAYVFAHALPEAELEPLHETVSVPDVASGSPYASEILQLYRAGILHGRSADGRFAPDSAIFRAEAAAIISRVACKSERS